MVGGTTNDDTNNALCSEDSGTQILCASEGHAGVRTHDHTEIAIYRPYYFRVQPIPSIDFTSSINLRRELLKLGKVLPREAPMESSDFLPVLRIRTSSYPRPYQYRHNVEIRKCKLVLLP